MRYVTTAVPRSCGAGAARGARPVRAGSAGAAPTGPRGDLGIRLARVVRLLGVVHRVVGVVVVERPAAPPEGDDVAELAGLVVVEERRLLLQADLDAGSDRIEHRLDRVGDLLILRVL